MVLGMILIRAHDLRNTDCMGKSDPYATVRFGSEIIGRTATVKDCLNPEWFEGIRGVLPLGDEATEVVIEVWDDDGGGALELDEGGQCNTLAGVGETLNLKMIVQEGGTTITEMKIESIVPGKEVI